VRWTRSSRTPRSLIGSATTASPSAATPADRTATTPSKKPCPSSSPATPTTPLRAPRTPSSGTPYLHAPTPAPPARPLCSRPTDASLRLCPRSIRRTTPLNCTPRSPNSEPRAPPLNPPPAMTTPSDQDQPINPLIEARRRHARPKPRRGRKWIIAGGVVIFLILFGFLGLPPKIGRAHV